MSVVVCGIAGEKTLIDVSAEQIQKMTVGELKKKSLKKSPRLPAESDVRMCFDGKTLDESSLLSKYGVKHCSVFHLVLRVRGG